MNSPFLYSVTFKKFCSQPDIPWGIMKHIGPIEECFYTNFIYFDGYSIASGNGNPASLRSRAYRAGLKAKPETYVTEQVGAELKSEVSTILRNKSLDEMQIALLSYGNDWERRYVVPYIQGFLDAEEEKLARSELLAALDEDDCC